MRELGAESGQERVLGIKLDREKITKRGRERVKRERERLKNSCLNEGPCFSKLGKTF